MHESTESPIPKPTPMALPTSFWRRRRTLIFLGTAVGLLTALILPFTVKPVYVSEAKLLVRYVVESKTLAAVVGNVAVNFAASRQRDIMQNEVEILTSMDLAEDVVRYIGADKITGQTNLDTDRKVATGLVAGGLRVAVPERTSILRLQYSHFDPTIAQQVLREIINGYLRKHVQIHREVGVHNDFLTKQRDRYRGEMATAESQLEALRQKAGVFSPDHARAVLSEQGETTWLQLLDTELELAQGKRRLETQGRDASTNSAQSARPRDGATEDRTALADLQAKADTLKEKWTRLNEEVSRLGKFGAQIAEWERRQALAGTNLSMYNKQLEAAQIADTLGPGKVSSITVVQNPSFPHQRWNRVVWLCLGSLLGGLVVGTAVAIVVEAKASRRTRVRA